MMGEVIMCSCMYPSRCAMNNNGFCVLNACPCGQINANQGEDAP